MTGYFFLDGIIFGLVLAAPVGPVAALCFERTITEGRLHGLLSSLGAAVADAVFGAIADHRLTPSEQHSHPTLDLVNELLEQIAIP